MVDAKAMSGSVAALVAGFAGFDPAVRVAGVVLNRVGSDGHETLLREALAPLGLPVLGALRTDDRPTWRDRHLGLIPVAERGRGGAALDRLADAVAERVDLEAVVRLARTAPDRSAGGVADAGAGRAAGPDRAGGRGRRPRLHVHVRRHARRPCSAGVEAVPVDPAHDAALLDGTAGLIAGGGFPEVHAADLAANEPLLADVAGVSAGCRPGPSAASLWLCRTLDGAPLVGACRGRPHDRPAHARGTATATDHAPPRPSGPRGRPCGARVPLLGRRPAGRGADALVPLGERGDGFATRRCWPTYLHVHPGGDPAPVAAFARACAMAAGA